MTTILLLFFIAYAISKTLNEFSKHYKSKLVSANSLEEARQIRKKAQTTRIIFLSIYIVIFSLFFLHKYHNIINNPLVLIMVFIIYVSFIWMVMKKNDNSGITLKSSTKGMDDIPEQFILYLRGFEKDRYFSDFLLTDIGYDKRFSENLLSEQISNVVPMVAIGMTKEVWQPDGAIRIYVDDKNWKNDVMLLMENSLCNIVLVDDKESCLWEIEQCRSYLDKTLFIVDDYEKYSRTKEIVRNLSFPSIESSKYPDGFFFHINHETIEIEDFNPSKKSEYERLSAIVFRIAGLKNKSNNKTLLLFGFGIASSILLTVILTIRLLSNFNMQLFILIVIILFFACYCLKFLTKSLKD